MTGPRILMVLTSHDRLGEAGEPTGFWLEEFAAPYYVFADAGASVTLASIRGGQPPIDPKSAAAEWQTEATRRFAADASAQAALAATPTLAELDAGDFDLVFIPGGHGPMWDFPGNVALAGLIEAFDEEDKIIAAVCHGPVSLVSARQRDGRPLVAGRRVTGFTNTEEEAVGLARTVPFLLQDRLVALGAGFEAGRDFAPHVITDGNLVTGQNPASSGPAAEQALAIFASRTAAPRKEI
jgi:putative intracellular protease/amidase